MSTVKSTTRAGTRRDARRKYHPKHDKAKNEVSALWGKLKKAVTQAERDVLGPQLFKANQDLDALYRMYPESQNRLSFSDRLNLLDDRAICALPPCPPFPVENGIATTILADWKANALRGEPTHVIEGNENTTFKDTSKNDPMIDDVHSTALPDGFECRVCGTSKYVPGFRRGRYSMCLQCYEKKVGV